MTCVSKSNIMENLNVPVRTLACCLNIIMMKCLRIFSSLIIEKGKVQEEVYLVMNMANQGRRSTQACSRHPNNIP